MKNILHQLIIVFLSLSLNSCFSSYLVSEKTNVQKIPQSKFATKNVVGMKKSDILNEFGLPISIYFEKKDNVLNQGLYYLELLGDIYLITMITLNNDIAVGQKVEKITTNYDERFNKIEKDLKILKTPRLYN